jgi:hypothetical protein
MEIERVIIWIGGEVTKVLIILVGGDQFISGLKGLVDALDDLIDNKQAGVLVLYVRIL